MATDWPVQQQGSAGENVRSVQHLLKAHGSSVAVDGRFGPKTDHAVRLFQADRALAVDGVVGDATWPALLVTVAAGSSGEAVRAVQSQINSRMPLAVDGVFGPETDSFVRAFQGPAELAADGIVGPATWHALVIGCLVAVDAADAAQRVFAAWRVGDAAAADRDATAAAVAALFARPWSAADGWVFEGCSVAAGSAFCTWHRTGGALTLQVNNGTGTPFFYVTGATFA